MFWLGLSKKKNVEPTPLWWGRFGEKPKAESMERNRTGKRPRPIGLALSLSSPVRLGKPSNHSASFPLLVKPHSSCLLHIIVVI